jgi:hypothetical protein
MTGAFREGREVVEEELLAAMGPGLAAARDTPPVQAARWSELAASMARRLISAAARAHGFDESEASMLALGLAAARAGGRHDTDTARDAAMALANLQLVVKFGAAQPPSVHGALAVMLRIVLWATRRARLDRRCPYALPKLGLEAVEAHADLADALEEDADLARERERAQQRREVADVLSGREVVLVDES